MGEGMGREGWEWEWEESLESSSHGALPCGAPQLRWGRPRSRARSAAVTMGPLWEHGLNGALWGAGSLGSGVGWGGSQGLGGAELHVVQSDKCWRLGGEFWQS